MSRIAAIVYGPQEDCDGMLADLAHDWLKDGVKVVGLVQINGREASCETMEMELEAVESGRRFNICQDLGSGSANACRLDPSGLAAAAGALRAALAQDVDVVIVNKFGRMEAEGGGLNAEIAEAVAAGLPLVIGVPARFAGAWDAFAGGLDTRIACDPLALEAWRRGLRAVAAAE